MSYKQLTFEQRVEIRAYLKLGLALYKIAQQLSVHKSTVSREVHRNSGRKGYRPHQAQQLADWRRKSAIKKIRFTEAIKKQVIAYLAQDWSPEQIAGYLSVFEDLHISHEAIYQFIWADKRAGGDLWKHLRQSRKKKKKRYGKNDRRGQIKDRVSIEERPAIVNDKKRIGDWELDTLIGANHQGVLVSAVERKSKFSCLQYVPSKEANLVAQAVIDRLRPFTGQVLTITVDNGKEFAFHKTIAEQLGATIYFAHPYRSWERGLNENTNGLIRQYFPKKHDFRTISKNDVAFVEYRLNTRPRKMLNFKKPQEVFLTSLVALGT